MTSLASRILNAGPLTTQRVGWIGVDVGNAAIKCAQVERTASGWRLVGSLVLPANGALGTLESSSGSFARDLRTRLVQSGRFTGRNVACVLPMSVTDLRTVDLPDGTDDELREMIEQELEQAGEGEAQCVFDFWHSGRKSEGELQQVDVLSISRSLAENLGHGLIRAGLRCHVLDGLPFTLARALQMFAPAQAAPVAAIDWASRGATVCICREGRPLFTRPLKDCGLAAVLERVQVGLDLSADESMQLLATYGLPVRSAGPPGELQQIIGEFVSEAFSRIVEELKRTLSYLRHQQGSVFPQRMCLMGGGAAVRNAAAAISAEVGLPVDVWELPSARRNAGRIDRGEAAMLGPAAAVSALAYQR